MSLEIGGMLGRFEIRALIGSGSMGVVYLARDTELDRDVAIKTLREDWALHIAAAGLFRNEAKTAAKVTGHDAIVTIYESQPIPGSDVPAIVMEFVDGIDLSRLFNVGRIELVDALAIAQRVLAALETSHSSGVRHGDIKPANILIPRNHSARQSGGSTLRFAKAKVTDFGIADSMRSVANVRGLPRFATYAYAAPELFTTQSVHPRDYIHWRSLDLFALGAVIYRALSGVMPFPGRTAAALSPAEPAPVSLCLANPAVPPSVSDVVMRSLSADPTKRYSTAEWMAEELNLCGSGATNPAPRPAPVGSRIGGVHRGATQLMPSGAVDCEPGSVVGRDGGPTLEPAALGPVGKGLGAREPSDVRGKALPMAGLAGPATTTEAEEVLVAVLASEILKALDSAKEMSSNGAWAIPGRMRISLGPAGMAFERDRLERIVRRADHRAIAAVRDGLEKMDRLLQVQDARVEVVLNVAQKSQVAVEVRFGNAALPALQESEKPITPPFFYSARNRLLPEVQLQTKNGNEWITEEAATPTIGMSFGASPRCTIHYRGRDAARLGTEALRVADIIDGMPFIEVRTPGGAKYQPPGRFARAKGVVAGDRFRVDAGGSFTFDGVPHLRVQFR